MNYDKENKDEIPLPKYKVVYRDNLQQMLKSYIENNIKIVAEVPSIYCTNRNNDDAWNPGCGAHNIPFTRKGKKLNGSTLVSKLRLICKICRDLICEAYELQHHKATELLAFVISTTDRIHEGEKSKQLPITYALKGYSLTGETLQKLINDVRNKCKEYGIMVLADCTDGQWAKITNRSENGKPLTKIQFQKDCWHAVCKKSKQVVLQNLVDYSVMDEEVLKIVETCMFVWLQTFTIGNLSIHY